MTSFDRGSMQPLNCRNARNCQSSPRCLDHGDDADGEVDFSLPRGTTARSADETGHVAEIERLWANT